MKKRIYFKTKEKSKASQIDFRGVNSPANDNFALRNHTISCETIRMVNDSIIKDKLPLVDNNLKRKTGHLFITFATGSGKRQREFSPEEILISYNGKIK